MNKKMQVGLGVAIVLGGSLVARYVFLSKRRQQQNQNHHLQEEEPQTPSDTAPAAPPTKKKKGVAFSADAKGSPEGSVVPARGGGGGDPSDLFDPTHSTSHFLSTLASGKAKEIIRPSGQTLLHSVAMMTLLSREEITARAQALLPYLMDHDAVNRADGENGGVTALHCASAIGNIAVVECILSAPTVDVDARTLTQWTPLHMAAAAGHVSVVDALLRHGGADVNAKNNRKSTPLHLAVTGACVSVVDRLLSAVAPKDIDVVSGDDTGATPLHLCALTGSAMLDVAEKLIAYGANANATDQGGRTPLHWALQRGHGRFSVLLMVRGGARCDLGDALFGVTALHLAASSDDSGMLTHMLRQNPNVDVRDVKGQTPLRAAIARGAANAVRCLLLEGKAKPERECLHVAFRHGHKTICRALLDAGADVDDDSQLLSMACRHGKSLVYIVEDLLKKRPASVHDRDSQGYTPLHWAAAAGDAETITALLEAGASEKRKDVSLYHSAVQKVLLKKKKIWDRSGVPRPECG